MKKHDAQSRHAVRGNVGQRLDQELEEQAGAVHADDEVVLLGRMMRLARLLDCQACRRPQLLAKDVEQVERRRPGGGLQIFAGLAEEADDLIVLIDQQVGRSVLANDTRCEPVDGVLSPWRDRRVRRGGRWPELEGSGIGKEPLTLLR